MARLRSRKLWITLAVQVAVVVAYAVWPDVPEHAIEQVVTLALGYLGAQGLVDVSAAIRKAKPDG